MWPHAIGVDVDPRGRGLVGHDRDLDSDSEYGEYPWYLGELAKVEECGLDKDYLRGYCT